MVPRPPGYQKNIKQPINYLINPINYFPRNFPINPLKGPYISLRIGGMGGALYINYPINPIGPINYPINPLKGSY